MDAWDEDFREPTEDERSARRVLSVAIALINARRPLTMVEIHREFYPEMSDPTFRKTFQRDRERLVLAGLSLCHGPKVDGMDTWVVDAESSFVRDNPLDEQDALVLDLLLLPLASDPAFPYARDLRLALNKIDRSFDGSSLAVIPPEARRRNNNISRLEDCMSSRHLARIRYRRQDGSETDRVVAPLGFFFLNASTYMVAAQVDGFGELVDPHTYNLDRMISVREQTRRGFLPPPDFDVRDFILLPFQIGDKLYTATFVSEDGVTRIEGVCDEGMAASWAIAQGLRPVEPTSLVERWHAQLEAAAKGWDDVRR